MGRRVKLPGQRRGSARAHLWLAVAAGVAGGVVWLPLGLAPLAPLFGFLYARALRCASGGRQALAVGFWCGLARYAVGGHPILWLTRLSPLAVAFYAVAVLYIVPSSLLEAWGGYWLERRTGFPRGLGTALLFTLLGHLRTFGDLSLPADRVAHAFGGSPGWLEATAYGGPALIALAASLSGALLEEAWHRRRARRLSAMLASAGAVLWIALPATAGALKRLEPPAGAAIRVGIVQPSVPVQDKIDPRRAAAHWPELRRLTREAAAGTDLVVWPETARPGRVMWEWPGPFRDPEMEAVAREAGVPILYGCEIVRIDRARRLVHLFNGASVAWPDGRRSDWYGKQRLLPLAEGFPFARYLGLDPAKRHRTPGRHSLLTMLGNFTPGPRPTVFAVGPARIGVLICYEGLYAQLARAYRRAGANVLAVITNDAWWGHSVFPLWHARVVAARAQELGVPVIRAANNGISSLTDREGRMLARTRLDEVTVLRGNLRLGGPPFGAFFRWGDLSAAAAGLALAVLAGWAAFGPRRRSHASGAARRGSVQSP
ncbi:MAG: apolipoprotein N-acyltransferase [Acidobacteria bacterium]|nr:MAG: apolipoprotein N-acyltransferase [Acidobacteriota bacterium]